VVELVFNGHRQSITSVEELGEALDRFDAQLQFELWASTPEGPSMCMLRNGIHAWLMYFRQPGDSGFNSIGNRGRAGAQKFLLSNGQEDEYPLSWCIEVEQCYKAVAFFFVNEGARPEWVNWHET
jgi:hypothetical protein